MAKPIEDTGWQQPKIVDGKGILAMPTGQEVKPCMMCKSFDRDRRKLIQFLLSRGMKAEPDGCYILAVIAGDLPGRRQMRVDPKTFGYCRSLCMPVHDESTCDNWKPTMTRDDLAGKVGPR